MLQRFALELALFGTEMATDSLRLVTGRSLDIDPLVVRRLFQTFDYTIEGKIPEILGNDPEERVELLATLLRGLSEDELNQLLTDLQNAFILVQEEERTGRRTRERSHAHRREARRHSHRH